MGGDLLGPDSLEEGLHVIEVGEHNRILVTVIRVNVALFHALQVLLIVALTVFSGVLWLDTI